MIEATALGLSFGLARRLAASVLEHARATQLPPMTVAVLDAGGHPITLDREDGASILRPRMAIGKAYAALALGTSSRVVAEMALERPVFVSALAAMTENFTPSAGGGAGVVG
ncbi:heme-binding protein [Phenylobacterium sp. Root700]|uniref:GlcG/HbpS family heme-binding protein n=1 Tax=Phenylobacterium sp. Root700 TaxID=1736591 RepID=UPI0009E93800|nr:heme-binding protein [Phenylobacterium sp. Root700]